MQAQSLPEPLVRPLESNAELIELISATSGEPEKVVMERLLAEERCIGANVRRDLQAMGVEPHVFTADMERFYETTKSFLYETSTWNRAPEKLRMRKWTGEFLARRSPKKPQRILSFGDGLGFDSAYLATAGHHVTYFEVSHECILFAKQVFAANEQDITIVSSIDQIEVGGFDAVLCMDVLEHVPSPPDTVAQIATWLKPGGWLITHSPFFFTSYHRVTHLKSNRRFSGSLELFSRHGLHPVDGRYFWNPIVLEKESTTPHEAHTFWVTLGRPILLLGRYANHMHNLIAQRMSSSDKRWSRDLMDRIKNQ